MNFRFETLRRLIFAVMVLVIQGDGVSVSGSRRCIWLLRSPDVAQNGDAGRRHRAYDSSLCAYCVDFVANYFFSDCSIAD